MNSIIGKTLMLQKMFDFEALETASKDLDKLKEDTKLPPPTPPTSRLLTYEGTPPHEWPEASRLHDRDTITVDRVRDTDDTPAHRFVIKRGDSVNVWFSATKQESGTVVGISHARNQVAVQFNSATDGIWFDTGRIYAGKEVIEPKPNRAPLSVTIEKLNDKHGRDLTEADRVPESSRPYLFADHKETVKKLADGSISIAEIHTGFTRLLNSKDAFIADLVGRFKAPKLKAIAARLGDWNANRNRKEENAASVHRRLLRDFHLSDSFGYRMGEDPDEVLHDLVMAQTEDDLAAYFSKRTEAKEQIEKTLSNPETLAEFREFIRHRGEVELTDTQLATFDSLNADVSRERRAKQQQNATVTRFEAEELGDLELSIKQGYHDKLECPLWIVQLHGRVPKEAFRELRTKAKMLSGWYSSFKRADAGFQFKEQETAERFVALVNGDADRSDVLERRKERREMSVSERLHELAKDMIDQAEGTIEASKNSLQNTVRRADMQAGIRGRAYLSQAMARTIHCIAEALGTGGATYLDGIRHRTQVATLDTVLRLARWERIRHLRQAENESDFAYRERKDAEEHDAPSLADIRFVKYPYPKLYKRHLEEAVAHCKSKKGVTMAAKRMEKRIRRAPEYIPFTEDYDIERLSDFLSRAKASGFDTDYLEKDIEPFKRLRRANIFDVHELRSALREYLPHKASTRGDDPIELAERELIGKKLPGFFPTPSHIIARMLERAEILPEHDVLEPSAGKGDIVQAIKASVPGVNVKALELNRTLADVLSAKEIDVEFSDFRDHWGKYDRIIMNPPFEKGQDMEHVVHAFSLLKPFGRLVAIMGEGAFSRSGKKALAFRDWLNHIGGESEPLPEDAFQGADAFRSTGVRTRLVVIDNVSF